MKVRDFSKEELLKSVVRFLRSGVHYDYACDYADSIENGRWLDEEVWEIIEHNEKTERESFFDLHK